MHFLKLFVACLVLLVFISSCGSLKPIYSKTFSDKYLLIVPDKWKKKGKLLNAISDILPATIKELEGKDFCLDCKASYTVKFQMYRSEGPGGSLNVRTYRLRAQLTVYNEKNERLYHIVVVDPYKDDAVFYNTPALSPYTPVLEHSKMPGQSIGFESQQYDRLGNARTYAGQSKTVSRNKDFGMDVYLKYAEKKIYAIRDKLSKKEM